MLTGKFEFYVSKGFLLPWAPSGGGLCKRHFWYTLKWLEELDSLRSTPNPKVSFSINSYTTVKEFVDHFVAGEDIMGLTKVSGKAPAFQKMRSPNRTIVEISTKDTRTFGFFVEPNKFIATCLRNMDQLKDENGKSIKKAYLEAAKKASFLLSYIPTSFDEKSELTDYVT